MPERIDHVAIIVRNIEQALVFYRDTLGITPSEIKEVPTEQVRIVQFRSIGRLLDGVIEREHRPFFVVAEFDVAAQPAQLTRA